MIKITKSFNKFPGGEQLPFWPYHAGALAHTHSHTRNSVRLSFHFIRLEHRFPIEIHSVNKPTRRIIKTKCRNNRTSIKKTIVTSRIRIVLHEIKYIRADDWKTTCDVVSSCSIFVKNTTPLQYTKFE